MSKTIFPEIEVLIQYAIIPGAGDQVQFRTWLRKEHRGKWYLWCVKRVFHYHYAYIDNAVVIKDQNIFLADIYSAILWGKVNPGITVEVNGKFVPLFELDPDQRSEEERLGKQFNPKK